MLNASTANPYFNFFNSFSAGVDFRHQNLTSHRRQILTSKVDPCAERVNGVPGSQEVNVVLPATVDNP